MDSDGSRLSGCLRNGTDQRMMITKPHSSSASSSLPALVLERKLLKDAEEEEKGKKTLGLGEDCSFCIFLLLPIDALQRASCVCKPWNTIIRNPSFVKSHLRHSDNVLLCVTSVKPNAKIFSVESHLRKQQQSTSIFKPKSPKLRMQQRYYLHFIEIKDGISFADLKRFNVSCRGAVLASCNGLILLQNAQKTRLAVLNPVTRKLAALPFGTIVPFNKESYGFAFNSSTKKHIVVHLFQEDSGYTSCEILEIEKKKWALVNGPPSGTITSFNCKPVFANGALHWLPAQSNWILWMSVEEGKFRVIPLPKRSGVHDGIIEMGGFLCFVTHELNQIEVWVLEGVAELSWTRRHTISSSSVLPDMAPLSGSRQGRWMVMRSNLVFQDQDEGVFGGEEEEGEEGDGKDEGREVRSLYVYDFHLQVMSKVRTKHFPPMFHDFLPHVNSLLWCDL